MQWLILRHRLLVSVEDAIGSFTDDEIMAIEQGVGSDKDGHTQIYILYIYIYIYIYIP